MSTKTLDTDKYFDEYTKNARTMLAWVYPTELRTILEKSVELQVETGKMISKTVTDAVAKLTSTK